MHGAIASTVMGVSMGIIKIIYNNMRFSLVDNTLQVTAENAGDNLALAKLMSPNNEVVTRIRNLDLSPRACPLCHKMFKGSLGVKKHITTMHGKQETMRLFPTRTAVTA